jgi:hypothetical protein
MQNEFQDERIGIAYCSVMPPWRSIQDGIHAALHVKCAQWNDGNLPSTRALSCYTRCILHENLGLVTLPLCHVLHSVLCICVRVLIKTPIRRTALLTAKVTLSASNVSLVLAWRSVCAASSSAPLRSARRATLTCPLALLRPMSTIQVTYPEWL